MKHWRRPSSKEQDCEYNEVGQSVAVLAANYSITALQTFWRGHDFAIRRSRRQSASYFTPTPCRRRGARDGLVVV